MAWLIEHLGATRIEGMSGSKKRVVREKTGPVDCEDAANLAIRTGPDSTMTKTQVTSDTEARTDDGMRL
jgi:hypothetical protein